MNITRTDLGAGMHAGSETILSYCTIYVAMESLTSVTHENYCVYMYVLLSKITVILAK